MGASGAPCRPLETYVLRDDREQNSDLVWRGRKLTLNYTGGSPCPRAGSDRDAQHEKDNWSKRHKSTLISLLCERDPLQPKAAVAFVGTNDECTYFFEVRTGAACPAVQVDKQQVGPSGVFGVMWVLIPTSVSLE